MAKHRCQYKDWSNGGISNYITSFEIMKFQDATITLVENWPCKSKDELLQRERYWIDITLHCINKQLPGRTQKQWNEDNKQHVFEQRRKYREENCDLIQQRKKTYSDAHKEEIRIKSSKYYKEHKEEVSRKEKIRREKNKELYKQRDRQKYLRKMHLLKEKMVCEVCANVISKAFYLNHCKSDHHNKFCKLNASIEETTRNYQLVLAARTEQKSEAWMSSYKLAKFKN